MKVTYTAHDGSHWDSESECLGWEKFLELREAAEEAEAAENRARDPDGEEDIYGLWNFLNDIQIELGLGGKGDLQDIWKLRTFLYQLTDLMKSAEQEPS